MNPGNSDKKIISNITDVNSHFRFQMDSFHNKVRLTFSIHYLTLVCRLSIYEICSESFMVFFNELPFAKQFLLAKSFQSAGLV